MDVVAITHYIKKIPLMKDVNPTNLSYHPSHTRAGSLKTCIYEGVRETSFSNASEIDISELVSADIVLTTYDVLKEDLSHDSDRHEGDRRLMRFHKRFLQNL